MLRTVILFCIYLYSGETGGHATQIIWAESYTVGCGVTKQKDPPYGFKFSLFCDYGPGANLPGATIYKRGKPGDECPEGTTLEASSGLCA